MSRPIGYCTVDGCSNRRHSSGLCGTHYRRKQRGRAIEGPLKVALPAEKRWLDMVDSSADGCWPWHGTHTHDGYGLFRIGSRTDGTRAVALAHRWGYEHFVGPIPSGMELDHTCRTRDCANPEHVEPVTHRVNMDRRSAHVS